MVQLQLPPGARGLDDPNPGCSSTGRGGNRTRTPKREGQPRWSTNDQGCRGEMPASFSSKEAPLLGGNRSGGTDSSRWTVSPPSPPPGPSHHHNPSPHTVMTSWLGAILVKDRMLPRVVASVGNWLFSYHPFMVSCDIHQSCTGASWAQNRDPRDEWKWDWGRKGAPGNNLLHDAPVKGWCVLANLLLPTPHLPHAPPWQTPLDGTECWNTEITSGNTGTNGPRNFWGVLWHA